MKINELITESAKLWGAKVRVNQPNYVGYVDAQVWASSAQIARTILKQQYNIQDHHVGSVKEIKMKANEIIKEANYNDPGFNPRVEQARIVNLKLELDGADYRRKQEIAKEIKQIEAQLRLYQATQPEKTAPTKEKRSDDGTPYTIYYDGQVSGRMLDTDLQGAKNVGKHTVMQQQAHTFAIVTDNAGNVVFVWYPGGHERPYEVGDKYNAPNTPDPYKDRPRYPAGHPHAGAPIPPNVPITTDWSKLPDGGIEAWMQGNQEPEADATAQRPEVYMGQAQRVDRPGKLPKANEELTRIAELAGVKVDEELNPKLGKILELANKFAVAIANMKIYTDDIFANHLKMGGLGNLVDGLKKIYTDQNYLSGTREASQIKQELGKLGVKVDYNDSFPTDFTLEIPGQSRPYTFNIIKLLKDATDAYDTKVTK